MNDAEITKRTSGQGHLGLFDAMNLDTNPTITDRFDWLVDWLYPPRCRACAGRIHGRDAEYFCSLCWKQIQPIAHPLCTLCGRPFPDAGGEDHACGVCLKREPHFVTARAWACYPREELEEHPLRQVVQKFKYGRKVSLGKPLGRLMARGCQEFIAAWPIDLILPVPLHRKRLRWRGFNQAALLARQIARAYQIPIDVFLLERRRETATQTQLSEEERRRNVRGAFALNAHRSVTGLKVLLIDDVYTSGATANECSRTLLKAGAEQVYVLTLARAVS
ncbi:MAG TPA: ComF family protein [Candidatus Binatia bacterium]|nr:ComF family protein [Candidatus Binatia bacterium]